LKLLPRDNTPCAYLVGFHFKSTVLKVKHVRLLSENSGQESYDCPAKEPTVGSCVTPVKKGVSLLAMTMNVAVYPYMSLLLLGYLLKESFYVKYFRLEILIRVNPLPI
jgi:hypothetical protein